MKMEEFSICNTVPCLAFWLFFNLISSYRKEIKSLHTHNSNILQILIVYALCLFLTVILVLKAFIEIFLNSVVHFRFHINIPTEKIIFLLFHMLQAFHTQHVFLISSIFNTFNSNLCYFFFFFFVLLPFFPPSWTKPFSFTHLLSIAIFTVFQKLSFIHRSNKTMCNICIRYAI